MEIDKSGGTIRGLSPIAGATGTGLNNAGSGLNQPQPHPSSPSAAQTPKEALTYLDLLYKTGRMQEVASILRRSEVFREAWLILQRSFATPAGVFEEAGPTKSAEAFEPEQHKPAALTPPQPVQGTCPGGQYACTPSQAHKVYLSHLNFYDQERNSPYRLSLWV